MSFNFQDESIELEFRFGKYIGNKFISSLNGEKYYRLLAFVHNWCKGMDYSRAYAAAQRHLLAWQSGVDIDDESGLSHLSHALANISFLKAYFERGTGNDDRHKTTTKGDK